MMAIRSMIAMTFSFGLSGCMDMPSVPEQESILNLDCGLKEIQILDESIELNDEYNWTAVCKGKTYDCTYHETAGSACYELND